MRVQYLFFLFEKWFIFALMYTNSMKRIFALVVVTGLLFQSSGIVLELTDLKLSQNVQIQLDIEGDTELEEKKINIDQIQVLEQLESISFLKREKAFWNYNTFNSFIFEIPFPPPEQA